jgi:dipeptide/tripeptide permease
VYLVNCGTVFVTVAAAAAAADVFTAAGFAAAATGALVAALVFAVEVAEVTAETELPRLFAARSASCCAAMWRVELKPPPRPQLHILQIDE